MIIAIIPKSSSVETLLNNLSEADFSLSDVSVVLKNQKLRDQIADDAGPLKGVTFANLTASLVQHGLSKQDAQQYANAVAHGQALVAMNVAPESQQAAVEMFNDYSPQLLKVQA